MCGGGKKREWAKMGGGPRPAVTSVANVSGHGDGEGDGGDGGDGECESGQEWRAPQGGRDVGVGESASLTVSRSFWPSPAAAMTKVALAHCVQCL